MKYLSHRVQNAARLMIQAFGKQTPQIILIIVLGFFASLLEGLGISAVIPIFSFFTGRGGTATDPITGAIMGIFQFLGVPYTFRLLLVFIGVLFVVRIVALFVVQNVTASIVFRYARDLRERILRSTFEARWPFLSNQKVGYLDQLLTTNTVNVAQFFGIITTLVMIFAKTIVYIVIVVNISLVVALSSLAAGAVLFFVLKPFLERTKTYSTEAEELNRKLAHFAGQHVVGMKTIKALSVEEPALDAVQKYIERVRSINLSMVRLRGFLEMGIQFAGLAFVSGVFAFMYKSGGFNLASFGVIVYAINQIFTQIQSAQVQIHGLSIALPYLTYTQNYILGAEKERDTEKGRQLVPIKDEISFQQVSFSYPERKETLKDISFTIRRGDMVGIVGPSGAGKSTVADLLLRLVDPSGGTISIDGTDIKETNLTEWRKSIGYVTQDSFLLNDTIRNNITFYEDSFSETEIIEAAKRANIHDFLMGLPHGYDTVVGDRGVLISGGERQRIALARVLARKPVLLVLDEATSSLDAASKKAIEESILKLRGKTTVVVIAHSDPIVLSADSLVVLNHGSVAEVGPPDTLSPKTRALLAKSYPLEMNGDV